MDLSKILFEGNKMNTEAFVYLWYDAPNKKYYLGWHKGTPDDSYTHSSTVWESFTKNTIPEGVTRRILTYGTDVDMANLEHKLLKNRKKRCWNRYYNKSVGDPRYVILSGEDHHLFGKKASPETRKKQSEAMKGDKNPNFGKTGKDHPSFGKKHSPEALTRRSGENHHAFGKTGEKNHRYGKKHSPETRKKQSEAMKGEKNPWFGKKHSPETLKKQSEVKIGKKHTPETRKKISEARMGKKFSLEHRRKLSEARKGDKNPMFGKKHTPETLKKLSEARRRYYSNANHW